jgi:hypothetical protein
MSENYPGAWTLAIRFDPLEIQEENDPENAWPNDQANDVARAARKSWSGLIEEELDECVIVTDHGTVLTLHAEDLGQFEEVLQVVLMNTVPEDLHLTRNYR